MANITLLGASYTDVPAVDLPQTGGGTVRFYENGGSGYTRTVIVPQQTVTASGNAWALVSSDANIVEGDEYIVTVNGVEKISTATKNGSINYISFIDWDWDSGGYAFGTEQSYNGVYFRAKTDGTYTVKVEKLELTSGSATLITKSITENGTYSAEDDDADGYSTVTVNVPSSGASSWTKVAETSYQVGTTSTSAATVDTWATGHSEIWTSDKIVYVRIRDTAGKRSGYFYGTDAFFLNYYAKNSPSASSTNISNGNIMATWSVSNNGNYAYRQGYNTTGYGIYPDTFYSDGQIQIRCRYSSVYSLTINSTYKVEVYLLDPPTGAPIFE